MTYRDKLKSKVIFWRVMSAALGTLLAVQSYNWVMECGA